MLYHVAPQSVDSYQLKPGVTNFLVGGRAGGKLQIDGAIIVRPGKQVTRVARRERERRFEAREIFKLSLERSWGIIVANE